MYKFNARKTSNQDNILECIYRNPRISRKEISNLTGITPATVTTTVASLMADGLICELGKAEEAPGSPGRSPISLGILADYGYVIGAEFNLTALTVCATDLCGAVRYLHSIPYTEEMGEQITQLLIEQIQLCIDTAALPASQLIGIGIAVPGHMDTLGNQLVTHRDIWGRFNAAAIRAAFPYPIVFENNVRCMAVLQYLHHPKQTPGSFALFHIGRGMFCANFIEDELYVGTAYGSGEIGHTVVDPDGQLCKCGNRGCLRTIATEQSLLEKAAVLYDTAPYSILRDYADTAEALTIDHIAYAYSLGDSAVRGIVGQAIKFLTISILNVAMLLNPEKLFLHGRLLNCEAVRQDLTRKLQETMEFTRMNHPLGTVEILDCQQSDGAAGGAALALLKCLLHM